MKRTLTLLILATGSLAAQPPRAAPVNEALSNDASDAYFQRGKNLYDKAVATGDLQHKIELFQAAATILEQYINEFPNHPTNTEMAWYYLGNSQYQGGAPEDGKRCFRTLLNRYGNGKWAAAAAFILANEHYSKNEFAFAAPLYEKFAANAGRIEDRPRGNYYAGLCFRMLGRDREALNAFKKVLDDPNGASLAAGSKFCIAQIQLKAGKAQEALAYFEEIAKNTGNPPKIRGDSALGASNAAAKLGQHDLAQTYLRFLLDSPGMEEFRADAQTQLMAQAFDRKDYAAVVKLFRSNVVRTSPAADADKEKEAARLMIAARAYMELKQAGEAQQLFRQVETLVPPENDLAFRAAYYRLHCFFQIEGSHVPDQVDAFLEIYRKTRPPDDNRIHTALLIKAETLFAEKKNTEAAEAFREINVNALSEENRAGALYKRGWCLAEIGDPQGAIRSLGEFLAKYPKDPRYGQTLAKRAMCYADSGESAKAIVDFDQLTAEGMPQDLSSLAWLESARMRRAENNIQDMLVRYKGLLGSGNSLNTKLEAEANYWIGWGMVKLNTPSEGVSYLEKARSLDAETYRKPAGLLLALGYSGQDSQKLAAEINLAIEGKYIDDIPDQAIQWAGMQAYASKDYKSAARFLALIANPAEPRETPKEVWRYLAKARLETGDAEGALTAANNVLAVEENPGWKADGIVDKGRALLALDRIAEARSVATEAENMRLQEGRTFTVLRMLSGDLYVKEKDLGKAKSDYLRIVLLNDDADLKPLALFKLVGICEQQGDKAEADKFREQLKREFPGWKAP